MKPILDVVLTIVFSILLAPVIILIILSYVILAETPIFFYQDRVGKDNRIFKIIKFRSLNEKEGNKNDVFALGRFLRWTSLDELPQLLNVLKQDMSLVGPRPLLPEYLKAYSSDQIKRHLVKPGITGWAQVNGRNDLSWQRRFDFDLHYINNVSFILDLKVMLLTVIRYFQFERVVPDFNEPFKGK